MISGIYCIKNTVNGRVYVGSAINVERRWREHGAALSKGTHDNAILQRSWMKHGPDSFLFSVIEYVADKKDLIPREQFWINKMNAIGERGYNMCPFAGNCLGKKFSAESKKKMSASAKNRPPISEATRAKLSETQKAVSPEVRARIAALHVGKKHTPESIAKMSAIKTGKAQTGETRAKIAASVSALMTPEHREEIAATLRGRKNGPHSIESIKKMSTAKMGHTVSEECRAKISATLRKRAEERIAA
jgi:group I intron endonuclease